VPDAPQTRYADNGDLKLAFQVRGTGPIDLLELNNGTYISIDETAEEPHWERYERRLATFSRLIRFDPKGIGLSDPLSTSSPPSVDDWMSDALAVLDAAGVERSVILGPVLGGATAMMLAATHPDRVAAIVLVNCSARWIEDDDYDIGYPRKQAVAWQTAVQDTDRTDELSPEADDAILLAPTLAGDPEFRRWWSRASRRGASPATARAISAAIIEGDVRAALANITVPTLVLHRRDNIFVPPAHGRYVADRIAGSRYVEVPGGDSLPYSGDFDQLVDVIEEFLTGESHRAAPGRVLAAILFADIVGSTEQAVRLGDRRWRELLQDHDAMVRRQLDRFRRQFMKSTGDGMLATFDGPAPAIECALAIRDGAEQLGISVRVGLHAGEVEVLDDDIAGIAVHIAQRVQGLAQPNEVLVSSTIKDLVTGSGRSFVDRGSHELKGVPDEWRLFAVGV
jgi:class 3 adenylate cyclase